MTLKPNEAIQDAVDNRPKGQVAPLSAGPGFYRLVLEGQ